jgi:hypothetical protein
VKALNSNPSTAKKKKKEEEEKDKCSNESNSRGWFHRLKRTQGSRNRRKSRLVISKLLCLFYKSGQRDTNRKTPAEWQFTSG